MSEHPDVYGRVYARQLDELERALAASEAARQAAFAHASEAEDIALAERTARRQLAEALRASVPVPFTKNVTNQTLRALAASDALDRKQP